MPLDAINVPLSRVYPPKVFPGTRLWVSWKSGRGGTVDRAEKRGRQRRACRRGREGEDGGEEATADEAQGGRGRKASLAIPSAGHKGGGEGERREEGSGEEKGQDRTAGERTGEEEMEHGVTVTARSVCPPGDRGSPSRPPQHLAMFKVQAHSHIHTHTLCVVGVSKNWRALCHQQAGGVSLGLHVPAVIFPPIPACTNRHNFPLRWTHMDRRAGLLCRRV